jgi:TolB protein
MVIDPMAHFRGAGVDAPEARPAEPPTLSRTRRAGVGAVALLLAAAGFGLAVVALRDSPRSPRQAEPPTEIRNGALAFRAWDIWVVNADGSGLRRLNTLECINDACDVAEGSLILTPWEWSPDGTRLACYGYAYYRDDEGGADYAIYLMSADGSEVTDLTSDLPELEGTSQGNPHWSPDGSRLAFDDDDGLYVVNADGSGVSKVARGGFPTWSPDGTRIAFLAASKGGGNEIRIANADGTGEMTVTEGGGSLDLPAWSPDGSRIAYIIWAKGQGPQLYVVNPDGTGETRLTDLRSDGMGGYSPSWSPDGSTIAIEVFEDGNWNLYLVNADGSGVRPLTDLSGDENRPTWAPDGTRIAFMGSAVASSEGENTGSFDVHLIDPDGTDLQKLTDGAGAAPGALTWQPLLVFDGLPSASPSASASISAAVSATTTVGADGAVRSGV